MIALFMVLLFGKLYNKMAAAVTLSLQSKILTFEMGMKINCEFQINSVKPATTDFW